MGLNARRVYDFYEFSGLFNQAFGDEKRIAYYDGDQGVAVLKLAFSIQNKLPYKFKDALNVAPTHLIVVGSGAQDTSILRCLKLTFLSIFDRSKYQRAVLDFLIFSVKPIPK
jgi:hypothetical protein